MRKKLFKLAALSVCCVLLSVKSAEAVVATIKGTLPSQIHESSGLDFTGGASFWTHNDGYGDNKLYKVSNTGVLSRTVTVQGATNKDWEDLTHDAGRNYMFIGDFGNNANDRRDLRIYKTIYPSITSSNTITAEVINFSYPDQTAFPSPWMNFDAEGFFHFNGKLYIFSKPDVNAMGYIKMYSVPDIAGTYVATLVDSFYTNDRVTGADISPDGSSVILMTNSRLHLFRNFTGDKFFSGQYTRISISGSWTQKEAISFWSNNEVYLTDEDGGSGGKLYYIDLSPWIPSVITTDISNVNSQTNVIVYPNPAKDYFIASFDAKQTSVSSIALFDLTGQLVRQASAQSAYGEIRMETGDLPSGVYFYKLYADNRELRTARLIISH
ncbi:MAG: T9SS C-terminal target domain-containing protein [Bacteroidetes bacterium]|nr:MAG: T9SS C-terminal target domain-containing protein [Bacteroidota bacterium]REK04798.1 MAG: T9SS C-terminal target domain-containing protein [Bacteroidota bacterium]REK36271.1 MAG: T9SS C-terminal target domain-containing protein [Bacteroidota bacterium]REK51065.1 MAG: T9SS C-terminal target domain-containing protein [Bacteroidota bacterium]